MKLPIPLCRFSQSAILAYRPPWAGPTERAMRSATGSIAAIAASAGKLLWTGAVVRRPNSFDNHRIRLATDGSGPDWGGGEAQSP